MAAHEVKKSFGTGMSEIISRALMMIKVGSRTHITAVL